MAAVPQLWESAIRVLQDLPDSRSRGTRCSTGTNTGHISPLAEALLRLQRAHEGRVPEATWTKLIRDKVPYRLAAACLKVLSNRQLAASLPPGPMGQSIMLTNGQYAILLLLTLVSQAAADCSLGNTSGQSEFGASLGQQLQQSGFVDILPQVLTDAADSLHTNSATEAAVCGEPDQHDDTAQSRDRSHGQAGTGSAAASTSTAAEASASSCSSSSNTSRGACGSSTASRHGSSIQMHPKKTRFSWTHAATSVLELFVGISSCWPARDAFVRQVAPACSAPAVGLAVEVLQHVSQHLSSATADELSKLDDYVDAWQIAGRAAGLVLTGLEAELRLEAHSLAAEADPMTGPASRYTARLPLHLEALINSPHLLPCLCLTMATSAYSTLLLQLPALPPASTQSATLCQCWGSCSSTATGCAPNTPKSNDSSGSSRSRRRKKGTNSKSSCGNMQSSHAAPPTMASLISNPMQAWQFACSQHHLLLASHDRLLHLLGSSSKVLLWAAAAAAGHAIQKLARRGMQPSDAASRLLQLYNWQLYESVRVYQDLAARQAADRLAGRLAVQGLLDFKAKLLCTVGTSTEQLAASLGVAATEQDRRWPFEQQLHYLIPAMVLYWAVNQPATIATSPNPLHRADVLHSCCIALKVVLVGPERKLERGKLLISQLSKQLSASEQQSLQAVLQHTASATPPACHVPQDVQLLFHQELLPLAAQAAKQLLAQEDSKLAGSSTGATSNDMSRYSTGRHSTGSTSSMQRIHQGRAVFSRDVSKSAFVIIELLRALFLHSAHTVQLGIQAQTMTSTVCNNTADSTTGSNITRSGTIVPDSSTAAQSALDLHTVVASWAPHAGLFCQLMELGLRGSRDVPLMGHVMDLFVLTQAPAQRVFGPLLKPALLAVCEPGSPQQLQLISLVSSLIKYMQTPAGRQKQDTEDLCCALFRIMMAMIMPLSLAAEAADLDSADADSEQSQVPLPALYLAGMLPWLVLLGRCCLLLADLLKSALAAADRPGNEGRALQGHHTAAGAAVQLSPVLIGTLLHCTISISSAQDWLQLSSTSAQLTAAGYSPQELLQQLQSTAVAAVDADNAEQFKTVSRGWVQAAAQALEALGVTLTTLAIPHACNNPYCSNLSGPSELQLVGGRSAICSVCLTARYCGKLCQRAHWKQHKPVCKALAAAAAAAAAPASTASTGGTSAAHSVSSFPGALGGVLAAPSAGHTVLAAALLAVALLAAGEQQPW